MDAEGGQTDEAVYEQRVAAYVHDVHEDGYQHRLLHELAAAEEGREGQVYRLQHHTSADDADVEHSLVEYLLGYAHHAVDGPAEEHQDRAHREAEDEIRKQRHRVSLAQTLRALRAEILGDEYRRRGADDREYDEQQVYYLVRIADGPDQIRVIPPDHDLVRIADQHLQYQLNKNGPRQAQNVVFVLNGLELLHITPQPEILHKIGICNLANLL